MDIRAMQYYLCELCKFFTPIQLKNTKLSLDLCEFCLHSSGFYAILYLGVNTPYKEGENVPGFHSENTGRKR